MAYRLGVVARLLVIVADVKPQFNTLFALAGARLVGIARAAFRAGSMGALPPSSSFR